MHDKKWIEISTDWFYHPSQSKAKFCIEKHDLEHEASWVFRVRVDKKPLLHPMKILPNTYYEGLWEYDVAEWFIADLATGKYIEFNLSPTGAWWMMVFNALRQRSEQHMPDISLIRTGAEMKGSSWSAYLKIPVSLIKMVLGGVALKHNVCFILGKKPREYLSWTRLSTKQPDFHQPADFLFALRTQG
jgi:hypothetical protein